MGALSSCCCGDTSPESSRIDLTRHYRGSKGSPVSPDPETRRRQMAEAAERRLREQEGRGLKDQSTFARLKAQQERQERAEAAAMQAGKPDGGLRVG